jgi:tetratricopeptide (TPR) repeat protein
LSEVALSAERDADAEDYAQQGASAVRSNDAIAPDALALLARTQILRKKYAEAEKSLTEGKRALAVLGKAKSLAGAWLTFVEATLISQHQNRFEQARPLFEKAIVEAVEVDGPASTAAIDMRLYLGLMFRLRNQPELARPHTSAAIATLEDLGGMSRIRAARIRAEILGGEAEFVSYSERIAVLQDIAKFLRSQTFAIPAEVLAEIEFVEAMHHGIWGEFALAKALHESSISVMLSSTQSWSKQYMSAHHQGWLALYRGEHEVADGHLRHAIELRARKDGQANDYPYASYDWAGLALNMSMQGRHREAEDVLQSAPAFSDLQGDPLSVLSEVIPRTLARVRLDAGDVRGAKQVFPTKEPAREDGRENLEVYYQTRGEIRCASGDHAAGLTDLTRSIRSQSAVISPNHPWVARARAVAGLCALALGNRKEAETFASEARRAFVAQPNVSPYFKEPLKRLDKQLGVKAI